MLSRHKYDIIWRSEREKRAAPLSSCNPHFSIGLYRPRASKPDFSSNSGGNHRRLCLLTCRSTAWAVPRTPCRGGLRRAPSHARCRGSRRGCVYMFSLRLPIYTDFLLPASRHNPRHNFNSPRSPSTKRHNRDIIAAWQWGGKSGQSTWKKCLSIKQWDVGISLLCSY